MALFHKPALGLDISDHSVEAVLVIRQGDRCIASSYGRMELLPGLVKNGEILDAKGLGLAVRKLLQDRMTPPLPKGIDRVAFALPESQVYMHIFEVPRLADERELGASLAVEADGFFPFPHDEMAASYAVIAQRPDKKDIYYAAVRKSVLESYKQFFSSIGLTPVSIEAESTALARAALEKEEKDPVALVDVGASVTDISIYDRDGVHFSETLEAAGEAFTQALAKAEGVPPAEAEAVKLERGVAEDAQGKGGRALREAVDVMLAGVAEALAYYEEKSKRPVKKVLFCGGSAMMPGLAEHATAKLDGAGVGRVVALLNPWKSVEPSEQLERLGLRTRSVLMATAIGLGLRGQKIRKFQEINFLNATSAPAGHLVPIVEASGEGPKAKGAPKPFAAARRGAPSAAGRAFKIVAGIVIGLLFAASMYEVYRYVMAWLKPPPPRYAEVAPAASDALPLEVEAAMAPAFSLQDKTLSGTPIASDVSVSKAYAHPAEKADGKAAGMIEIVNTESAPRTLIATTRFLSEGGVLFRLDQAASVPAGGRVAAHVTADQPGEQGDVPAGRFTIPGLPPAAQKQIYGESTDAMSGGVAYTGAPFTEAERAQAADDLLAQAKADAAAKAAALAGDGTLVPDGLIAVAPLDIRGLPAVGAPTGDYTPQADAAFKAFALHQAEIDSLLRQELAAKLAGKGDPASYDFNDLQVTVVSLDAEAGTAVVKVTANASTQ